MEMLENLFKDIKGEITYILRTIFITVSIFLTTMIYGENINLQFDCEIPNAVYEYEVGDTVEFAAIAKNKGKIFETRHYYDQGDWIHASVYKKDENGNTYRLYYSHEYLKDQDVFVEGYHMELLYHGYEHKKTFSFIIPEDAPKGEYIISLSCSVQDDDRPENNGRHSETFEGLITVK